MLTQAARDNSVWQERASVSGDFADWLVSDRLMTPDIRRSFDGAVRVEVLRESPAMMPQDVADLVEDADASGWVREIAMYAGATMLVRAACYAPARTVRTHPWLTELGDSPLGGTLAQRDDVARVAQHYCPTEALEPDDAGAGRGAWSRRSLFLIGDAPLVLIEHLSAGFADVPRRTREDDDE